LYFVLAVALRAGLTGANVAAGMTEVELKAVTQ
jgi:hypothetical protein